VESVWWVFSQLAEKNLVYRGFKVRARAHALHDAVTRCVSQVMPYSTAVHTPLSNFEAKQNYKDVDDPAGTCVRCRARVFA
jgi:isoleucyl-tRNA synthetase